MSDISLYQQALLEYNKKQVSVSLCGNEQRKISKRKSTSYNTCKHIDVIDDKGIIECMDCGEEIVRLIMHEQEWRNYGPTDGGYTADPSRVHRRKTEDRSIHKDVENLGFSDIAIDKADEIYKDATGGKIFRGGCRKSIIFASIFHAYRILGKPQNHDNLIKIMGLTRRVSLKGIKFVNLNVSKKSEIHSVDITPATLVVNIMQKFSAHPVQIHQVSDLYSRIENRSSKLNQARPQSVSSGVVYYWIRLNNLNITIEEFAAISGLSTLTISNMAKEVSEILNTKNVIIK